MSKITDLEKDPAIELLGAKLRKAGKSPHTFETYCWHLRYFFDKLEMSPSEFIKAIKAKKIDPAEEINKATDALCASKAKSSYVKLSVSAVKKLIKVNLGKDIENFSDVALDEIGRDTKIKEQPLDVEQMRAMLHECRTKRDRAMFTLAASTGLRRQEIAGLNVSDIFFEKDRTIVVSKDVLEDGMPCSKGKHGYVTFLTPEARKHLLDYLEGREGIEDKIQNVYDEDKIPIEGPPLFLPEATNAKPNTRLAPASVSEDFRELMYRAKLIPSPTKSRKTRHPIKPHSIRKFTRRMYLRAGIELEWAEKLLGHKTGSLQAIYTPSTVNELWEQYQKAIPYLTVEGQPDLSPLLKAQEWKVIQEILRAQGHHELADKMKITASSQAAELQAHAFLRAQATLGKDLAIFFDPSGTFYYKTNKEIEDSKTTEEKAMEGI